MFLFADHFISGHYLKIWLRIFSFWEKIKKLAWAELCQAKLPLYQVTYMLEVTKSVPYILRVSSSEASGAGFEKANCLFLTFEIARTFLMKKIETYMLPLYSPLISR